MDRMRTGREDVGVGVHVFSGITIFVMQPFKNLPTPSGTFPHISDKGQQMFMEQLPHARRHSSYALMAIGIFPNHPTKEIS